MLGENATVQIGTDKEDGDFEGDAGRAAHKVKWQVQSQRERRGGTI